MVKNFVLLSRSYCHLCTDFERDLLQYNAALPETTRFRVTTVDIDTHPSWLAQHDENVPVLLLGDTVVCQWHFDPVALQRALA